MVPPGQVLGVFGGGQLGRMLGLVAQRLGYRFIVFCPDPDAPAAAVADEHFASSYDDLDAVERFAKAADVITIEFENIPTPSVRHAGQWAPVHPSADVLEVAQHRVREKQTIEAAGFQVTPFRRVTNEAELTEATDALGFPLVLKTATFGYDGKGQSKVANGAEARRALAEANGTELIAEAFVPFVREVSILVARSEAGRVATYPVVQNIHRRHILHQTIAPANVDTGVAKKARQVGTGVAEALGLVGLICVELFEREDGQLLVNEIAPRPHNSGHHTIDACAVNQFEMQLRAVCGLPFPPSLATRPCTMTNLLGDVWTKGHPPDWTALLAASGTFLHLYGKSEARPGRKMGHFTVLSDTADEARREADDLFQELSS